MGRFVAVALNSAYGAYSDDYGATWHQMQMPSSAYWYDVIYAQNKFVAISSGGSVALSEDGIHWRLTGNGFPSTNDWRTLGYGNGVFVALAYNVDIGAWSEDAITWHEFELPTNSNWCSVAYNRNMFCAVTYETSSRTAFSYDGKIWIAGTSLPSTALPSKVIAKYGTFIVIAKTASAYQLASSGWSTLSYTIATSWQTAAYDGVNNRTVAVNQSGTVTNYINGSGSTWTAGTGISSTWQDMAAGDGHYVLIATGTSTAAYSYDGLQWNSTTLPSQGQWNKVCYGDAVPTLPAIKDDGFYYRHGAAIEKLKPVNISFGVHDFNNARPLYTSIDGINYKSAALPYRQTVKKLAVYGKGRFIVYTTNLTLYSDDGVTWKTAPSKFVNSNTAIQQAVFLNNKFIFFDEDSDSLYISDDGIDYVRHPLIESVSDEQIYITSIAYGNNVYVATCIVGSDTGVVYSYDAITWIGISGMPIDKYLKVYYFNDYFILISYLSQYVVVRYSDDGIHWTRNATMIFIESLGTLYYDYVAAVCMPDRSIFLGIYDSHPVYVYRSTDAGRTFNLVATEGVGYSPAGEESNQFLTSFNNVLAIDHFGGGTGEGTHLYSTDYGVTWTTRDVAVYPMASGIPAASYQKQLPVIEPFPPPPPPPPPITDRFVFTVEDGGSFGIPVSGINNAIMEYQSYDWLIDWGDGNTENASGTGSSTATIPHTYTDGAVTHTITIRPNGTAIQGWFNAFGSSTSQGTQNLARIKSIDPMQQITDFMRTINRYSHAYMFQQCTGLQSIPENLLPATTLAAQCYQNMFYGCTELQSIPDTLLPAETLAATCYAYMFVNCSKLQSIPATLLPAETLANQCYWYMFNTCAGLQSIPVGLLPATTLSIGCYGFMFSNCNGLQSIPAGFLPVEELIQQCYTYMFNTCTALTDIGDIDAEWFSIRLPEQASMFTNCTAIATPITYANIPSGWK